MVDVQVGAKHVVDVVEPQTGGGEAVEPRLLGKVEWRRIALVFAGAGVDQDDVLGRPHHEGLIGDHHASGRRVEYCRIELGEMAPADVGVIGGEHVLRPPPRPVALDDAGNGDVADLERPHAVPVRMRGRLCLLAGPAGGKVNDEGCIYYPIKCCDAPRR